VGTSNKIFLILWELQRTVREFFGNFIDHFFPPNIFWGKTSWNKFPILRTLATYGIAIIGEQNPPPPPPTYTTFEPPKLCLFIGNLPCTLDQKINKCWG
jgi:hypothetical protein